MSKHSICFAGLSREEEAEVISRFKQANARVGNPWQVVNETEAAVLVIDMDSMYGQMSLMKALGTGKILVALTASGRAETDYVLQRPVTIDALVDLLGKVASHSPAEPEAAAPVASVPAPTPAPPAPAPVAAPAAAAPEPAPKPEPVPASAKVTTEQPAMPALAPARPAEPRLADYLRPGALAGPVRVHLDGAPELVLDPGSQSYFGGTALKPLVPYASAVIHESDLSPVAAAELPALAAKLGAAQPFARLAWLCALAGGHGNLAPGYGLNDKYKLLKWPQSEREYPKHFRIATVMMKGPALLTDIAELSGASLAEVIDFVNACLVAGVATPDSPAPAEPDAGKGGLLGRFRR